MLYTFLATRFPNKFCPAAWYGFSNQYESERKSARPLGASNVSKSYITGLFRCGQVVQLSNYSMMTYFVVGVETILGGRFIADWGNDGTLWEAWRRTCTPQSSARRLFSSIRGPFSVHVQNHFALSTVIPRSDFSFTKGSFSKQDFCDVPMLIIPRDISTLWLAFNTGSLPRFQPCESTRFHGYQDS